MAIEAEVLEAVMAEAMKDVETELVVVDLEMDVEMAVRLENLQKVVNIVATKYVMMAL